MEIILDGKDLDFKLESEKNLNEVLIAIDSQLAEYNQFIKTIHIDGNEIEQKDSSILNKKLLSEINKLGLTTTSYPELISESLGDIISYMIKFTKKIEENDYEIVSKNASEGISWLKENIILLSSIYNIDLSNFPNENKNIKKIIDEILNEYSCIDLMENEKDKLNKFNEKNKSKITQLYQNILLMAKEINNKIKIMAMTENPESNLESIKIEIKEILDKEILSISTNMQTGKEKEAMDSVQKISFTMEKLVKIFQSIESKYKIDYNKVELDGQDLKSWIEHLMNIGNEIIDAFNKNDTVLIADLFEYEFGENFSKADGFIDMTLNKIRD